MTDDTKALVEQLRARVNKWPYEDGAYRMINACAETIESQTARIAELEQHKTNLTAACNEYKEMLGASDRRIAELERELAAALAYKPDAERLEWADKHLLREATMRFGTEFKAVNAWSIASAGTDLRVAIDAARKEGR